MEVTRTIHPKEAFARRRTLQKAGRAFAAVSCFILLSSCSKIFPSDTIRFRIDLAIPTIHGVVHGSGVLRGKYERTTWPTRNAFSSTLTGEAILIELPNNAAIVATLRGTLPTGKPSSGIVMLPERMFTHEAIAAEPDWGGKRERIVATIAAHKGWTKTMTYSEGMAAGIPELPFLVYLSNKDNPKSLRALRGDPVLTGEPKVTVTVTGDRVNHGLKNVLPWIVALDNTNLPISGRKISSGTGDEPLQDIIGAGSFTTELN